MTPWKGNIGPVIFALPVPAKIGDYLRFEECPTLRGVILRAATRDEFLASRAERLNGQAPTAGLLRRLSTAYFYEVQAD